MLYILALIIIECLWNFVVHVLNCGLSVFFCRCVRLIGCVAHRIATGKIAMRSGGVLSYTVSQPADTIRQAAVAFALAAHGVTGRKNHESEKLKRPKDDRRIT